jgi:hypothetical protein
MEVSEEHLKLKCLHMTPADSAGGFERNIQPLKNLCAKNWVYRLHTSLTLDGHTYFDLH